MQALLLAAALSGATAGTSHKIVTVACDGSGNFRSVQEAVASLPSDGGTVRMKPGTYRERVSIAKPHVRLEGDAGHPSGVVIVYNSSHSTAGGTLESATVTVDGDDFSAEGITFQNDFSVGKPLMPQGSQAVALLLRGDRAVLRHVRLLGAQDTVYLGSQSCASEQGPCVPARQYLADCYVEGNVDFIFGDSMAVFHNCEIHAIAHSLVFLTAQSKHYAGESSGYVFDHCRVTADPDAKHIFLGRPWRPYSTVVFRNTQLDANIEPAGWREWHPGETHSLDTSFYAEFHSSGRGSSPSTRDSHSKQLKKAEARKYSVREFLRGSDDWNPEKVH
jgi:pectin methylesterase-like acyl-CoA thioesterase